MFPVSAMNSTTGFDIALHVKPTELAEVRVAPRNYRMDSLQNRKDYEKIFNYQKPGIGITDGPNGAGLDLDQLINVFRFKRNRRLAAFQARLVEDEQDKFINHRFTRYHSKKDNRPGWRFPGCIYVPVPSFLSVYQSGQRL